LANPLFGEDIDLLLFITVFLHLTIMSEAFFCGPETTWSVEGTAFLKGQKQTNKQTKTNYLHGISHFRDSPRRSWLKSLQKNKS